MSRFFTPYRWKQPTLFLLVVLLLHTSVPVGAYQFTLTYLREDGSEGRYDDHAGSDLLVDAMATWCGPCELSMIHLEEVYIKAGDQVPLLSISLDPESDTL